MERASHRAGSFWFKGFKGKGLPAAEAGVLKQGCRHFTDRLKVENITNKKSKMSNIFLLALQLNILIPR